MSKYTTKVRDICEYFSGLGESVGYYKVNEVIDKSREKIFDFDYPIFDEKYRTVLETKILKHYYTREIGFETIGLWLMKLETKLNEIMPYYNQLYKSELLEFNPFYDTDITTTRDIVNNGNSESVNVNDVNSVGNYVDRKIYSDTPQGSLKDVESGRYMTNATKNYGDNVNNSKSVNNGNSKINNVEDYLEHIKGKRGGENYSSLLQDYRKTFLNIDMMIIDDLYDLFMLLW